VASIASDVQGTILYPWASTEGAKIDAELQGDAKDDPSSKRYISGTAGDAVTTDF
jgi:hypothetical protein